MSMIRGPLGSVGSGSADKTGSTTGGTTTSASAGSVGSRYRSSYRRESDNTGLKREEIGYKRELDNKNKESGAQINGSNGDVNPVSSMAPSSTSSTYERSSYERQKYVPYSERYNSSTGSTPSTTTNTTTESKQQNPLSVKREREAFFSKSDSQYQPKFDPHGHKPNDKLNSEKEDNIQNTPKLDKLYKENTNVDGYVGFANLPNQVYRKSVKRGFEFNLMVVGESGLGKSTLINSLFLTDLYNAEHPGPSHRIKKTVAVETNQVLLKEGGVSLKLTVVDTPGFGDAVDNSNCWQPVIDYINNKYDEYLNAESRVCRKVMPDTRIHCCLYFITPSGHGLKPLDVEFMKRLHDKVNIIPLIAKADTLTPDECREFKKTILNEIAQHKIKIYEFPDLDDEEENKAQKKLKERVPFAVVGSNALIDVGGKKVRGRIYPWGVVEVENLSHNDFIALRNMLIRSAKTMEEKIARCSIWTHMQDLKDMTNNIHYENFRYNKLATVTTQDGKVKANPNTKDQNAADLLEVDKNNVALYETLSATKRLANVSPLLQMEEEKKEHDMKLKKMEAEMEQVFEMKVKEKQDKLKLSEADLGRHAEQMKRTLEQQSREHEEKRQQFEKERLSWEESQKLEEQRRRSLENSKEYRVNQDSSIDGKDKHKKEKKKGIFT
ncbi:septin-7-like isoform X4 [Lineus longissimus]|uniref:septin-7-like isoform X4 n=1 Tax=Lineus longissimus TaxID=88925 RepID=UPI00315DD81F